MLNYYILQVVMCFDRGHASFLQVMINFAYMFLRYDFVEFDLISIMLLNVEVRELVPSFVFLKILF